MLPFLFFVCFFVFLYAFTCRVKAGTENSVMADYSGNTDEWGDEDPSVFEMHIFKTIQGEYQLTNGYGPDAAPKIMMVQLFDSVIFYHHFF